MQKHSHDHALPQVTHRVLASSLVFGLLIAFQVFAPSSLVQPRVTASIAGASFEPVSVTPLRLDALGTADRELLVQLERSGTCPETLRTYLPGFYELCMHRIVNGERRLLRATRDKAGRARILLPVGH